MVIKYNINLALEIFILHFNLRIHKFLYILFYCQLQYFVILCIFIYVDLNSINCRAICSYNSCNRLKFIEP